MTDTGAQDNQRFFDTLDRAKGILIVLIVFAHNTLITKAWPESRAFLYNWHVYAFLLLALVMPFNSDRPGFLTTRFVRYYVPFVAFFTLTWLAAIALDGGFSSAGEQLEEWALAVVIGSAALLDQASGARLFWFLPALMGLVLIRWLIDRFPKKLRTPLLLATAITGFLTAGLIPDSVKPLIPFGLPIALYAIGPGLVFAALIHRLLKHDYGQAKFWALAVASALLGTAIYALTLDMGTMLVLASFDFYDLRSPLALVTHAALAIVAASTVVLLAAAAGRVGWLEWLGRASLLIYLLHQIVFFGFRAVALRLMPPASAEAGLAQGLATFAGTMAVTVLLAWSIGALPPVKSLLTPRDWHDWQSGFRWLQNPFRF